MQGFSTSIRERLTKQWNTTKPAMTSVDNMVNIRHEVAEKSLSEKIKKTKTKLSLF